MKMESKNKKIENIMKKVLDRYSFSKEELRQLNRKIAQFTDMLKKNAKAHKLKADIILGGSAAKGTMIKGDFDCDIFIRFDRSYADADISGLCENILSGLNYTRLHGSRDYFQLEYNNINYEIVPVINIKSPDEALNITDISPLHVRWLKEKAKENKRLTDEIIIAKVFFKANSIYGAESYIRGFSGHVIDILIVFYKSFLSLIQHSLEWKKFQEIDVAGTGNIRKLNKSKISPLIVYDPIQPERNAAASLSYEKFMLFKKRAKEFLESPEFKFFVKRKISIESLKEQAGGKKLSIVEAVPYDGKKDIVGSKLLKAFQYIKKQAKINGFTIISSGWEWDKNAVFWFISKNETLSEKFIKQGPPLSQSINAKKFIEKNRDYFIKNNRLYARADRKYRKIGEFIKDILNSEYIREKLKSARLIKPE